MFTGEYTHNIDSKGRIFVPAKFREELGNEFVVTRGVDNCLSIYSLEGWAKFTERISALPSVQSRTIRRFVFRYVDNVSPDSQGRILIKKTLSELVGLSKNAIMIGMGDYIEVWDESALDAERAKENPEDIAKLMIDLGF